MNEPKGFRSPPSTAAETRTLKGNQRIPLPLLVCWDEESRKSKPTEMKGIYTASTCYTSFPFGSGDQLSVDKQSFL